MNVRKLLWTSGIAGVLLAAAATYMLSTPVVSVTPESHAAIQPGMTVAEVSAIIGGPPRWYDGIHSFGSGVPYDPDKLYRPRWVSSDGEIVLDLDDDGKVTTATYAPIRVCDQWLVDFCMERLTRGMGSKVVEPALLVLFGIALVVAWRLKLIAAGVGSAPIQRTDAWAGLWLRLGPRIIAVCAWRKRASA